MAEKLREMAFDVRLGKREPREGGIVPIPVHDLLDRYIPEAHVSRLHRLADEATRTGDWREFCIAECEALESAAAFVGLSLVALGEEETR
jgi:hypothetical protein